MTHNSFNSALGLLHKKGYTQTLTHRKSDTQTEMDRHTHTDTDTYTHNTHTYTYPFTYTLKETFTKLNFFSRYAVNVKF